MEITHVKKRNKKEADQQVVNQPKTVNFYNVPPQDNITLQEFEELALERLSVLRLLDEVSVAHASKSEEWRETFLSLLRKRKVGSYNKLLTGVTQANETMEEAAMRDNVSHFILRLAYCRSEELRRWFLSHETDLFRVRIHNVPIDTLPKLLQENNVCCELVSDDEIQEKRKLLIRVVPKLTAEKVNFFKVPFTDVLELVRLRKVYLLRGVAYVPASDLVSILVTTFRTNLSHALALTARFLPQVEEDERLVDMLRGLDRTYHGPDFSQPSSDTKISVKDIDRHAKSSFPLCMRQMHETLKEKHHLRHGARLQYGLFLKGIGLTLEESMSFWRSEFTKTIDVDKFDKQFAYGVRHSYGKEGKRANYTPYSCMKIIMQSVGPGDQHGCPFKHSDQSSLRQKLLHEYNLPAPAVEEIMDLVSRNHYQIACQKYFEVVHKKPPEIGINHPNQYFQESLRVLTGGQAGSQTKSEQANDVPHDSLWDEDIDIDVLAEAVPDKTEPVTAAE